MAFVETRLASTAAEAQETRQKLVELEAESSALQGEVSVRGAMIGREGRRQERGSQRS